ncbi:MAG TPA: rhodanese-like domain-containing protein [Sulfuricaulis sp.]
MNIRNLMILLVSCVLATSAFAAEKKKPPSPLTVDGAVTVDAAQAKAHYDKGVVFLDVRSDKDWAAGRIKGAKHLELKKKYNEDSLSKLVKKDEGVVIYCNGSPCPRSSQASAKAVGWGYTKVYYFRDGVPAWKTAGFPTEK